MHINLAIESSINNFGFQDEVLFCYLRFLVFAASSQIHASDGTHVKFKDTSFSFPSQKHNRLEDLMAPWLGIYALKIVATSACFLKATVHI